VLYAILKELIMSQFGSGQFGSSQFGALEIINNAIENSEIIPKHSQKAIQYFLRETIDILWSNFENILNLEPPIELLENWDLLIELVKALLP
jgi:hypothetical protein